MLPRPLLAGVWHQACSCRAGTWVYQSAGLQPASPAAHRAEHQAPPTPTCPHIPPPMACPWHLPSGWHGGVNHCDHKARYFHLHANTGGVRWTPMDLTASQNQFLCMSWCCPLCLHGGQDLELYWWKPELKGEVSPQQARMLPLPNFQEHLCFSPKGEKNTSKEAVGDGELSQCLLNSWEGIIDFGVLWISPSFCRVIILSYPGIALYKPWCHFCKYPATPDFENPE